MLIKSLEIGGIEGAYRIAWENVMRVVREHKDVYDPLISFGSNLSSSFSFFI